jgi:hypothetical protein
VLYGSPVTPRTPNAVRTTRAYIASFGTTGTLIAAALLTMSLMSAIVAFDGFPSQDLQDPIGSVQVLDRQAPLAVEKHPANAGPAHAQRASGVAASHRRHHHGRAGSAKAPVAHANPVGHRGQSGGQTQTQAHQPSGGGSSQSSPVRVPDTSPVTSVAPKVPSAPSVPPPETLLKSSPVTLPGGSTLPVSLPINTAAVSGVVDGLLGQ